jgi:hypothetical protein
MLFFQLTNYRRIYQDEYNTLKTLCRVLAVLFSYLCNEQFKNVQRRKKHSIATQLISLGDNRQNSQPAKYHLPTE